MNGLSEFLVEGILNETTEKIVALFGGGFKPPTKGHLDVVNQGLQQNPEITEIKILVGSGEREGFTQNQTVKIWNLYNDVGFISKPATIIPVSSPFTYYKNYLKDNPDDKVYVFIGSRPGEEKDQFDVKQRSEFVKKYSDNVVPVEVATGGGVSGTLARKLFKTDIDGFRNMFPENLLDQDFQKILDILNNKSTDSTRKSAPKATEPLTPLNEGDPKKGTGKKPKGSGRRLYTDEDPKDTVGIKFSTRQDIVNTLNKKSFKAKSHARQSQIINLIHQRVRAAYGRAKDPAVKKRLKTGLDYITDKKEASKKKTQRLKKQKSKNENIDPKSQSKHKGKAAPFGSAYEPVDEGDTYEKMAAKGKKAGSLKQGTVRKRLKIPKDKKIPLSLINKELSRLKKMDKDKDKKGVQLGDKNQKYYKALQLSKTLKTTTNVNENATYSSKIDYKQQIKDLTKHMIKKGMNILPLPRVIFKHGDQENASQFLGKTAYYSPEDMTVVLYTEGRHPKDIVRSFAHEMIHHIQNLEGRLHDISTTNTMEDDHLNDIEREAYTRGNMVFRNWTDSKDGEEVSSLNENLNKNPNHLYHWTSYSSLKKIIESNKLKSNKSYRFFEYDTSRDLPDYKNVVFFTIENERFADEETSNQCILVVDKSKLSKDYKVISYGDPYEETVVYTNDPSIPILPYLKGVLLMNTLQKSALKKTVAFLESKNIPYEINYNLEKKIKEKKAKLPSLKKELINKLKSKYPNGFVGYLETPLLPFQTIEYFKDNPTYNYPKITINKPGKYGEKNEFKVKFDIKPQNLEKYINWFRYSPDSIEDLINMDNYEGEELDLKGEIPIDINNLNEAIVGEKIECDNCDWSWNIVDGGDDLYMCHKCGHDNEPKNGDPFGLKAFARELMEDFNIEDIKPVAKSVEKPKEVRIFNPNCGCDKT